METHNVVDSLTLGTQLVSLVDVGRRESTYKLATLTALMQISLVKAAEDYGDGVEVEIADVADSVARLYWEQLRVYDADGPLAQVKTGAPRLLGLINEMSGLAARSGFRPARGNERAWSRLRTQLSWQVASYPLAHLQNGPAGIGGPLLYDEPWLVKKLPRAVLDEHRWSIRLLPGIAPALATLSGLLIPLLQRIWVEDVRRFNAQRVPSDRVADFLFSADRAAIAWLAEPLSEFQSGQCFYCRTSVEKGARHVDHVLPWSRTGVDDLANLVLACTRCNLDKSDALAHPRHVTRAVGRDLAALAKAVDYTFDPDHVRGVAVALYRWAPTVTLLWDSLGKRVALGSVLMASDIAWPSPVIADIVGGHDQDPIQAQRASSAPTALAPRI